MNVETTIVQDPGNQLPQSGREAERLLPYGNIDPPLRIMLEQIPAIVWVVDRDLRITYSKGKGLKSLGLKPDELVGLTLFEYINTDDPNHPSIVQHRRALAGESMSFQTSKDDVELASHLEPLRNPDGEIIGAIGVCIDNTVQRDTERELHFCNLVLEKISSGAPQKEIFQVLLRALPTLSPGAIGSILLVDSGGKLTVGSAPDLPEEVRTAIEGIPIGPGVGACGTAAALKKPVFVSDIETDPLWEAFRELALRHDLRAVWSHPILDSEGDCVGTVSMYFRQPRRPSEREMDLIAKAGYMAALAIEKHRTENRLRQTLAELARSNRDLEEFASVASHDLAEPLRMVSSFLELLKTSYHQQLDPKALEFVNYAMEGSLRMRHLIQGLLEYSKVSYSKLRRDRIDCTQMAKEVLDDLQLMIDEAGAQVTYDPLPELRGDLTQFRQLFQNLITNAIKFRASQSPRVHLSAVAEGSDWVFSIRDNGIGVPAEQAERIFIIFQRLGRTHGTGVGLGLALCKKIIQRHGGKIWLDTTFREGACLKFSLARS